MNVSKGEDTKRDPETEIRRTVQNAGDRVDAGVAAAADTADRAILNAEQGVSAAADRANQAATATGEELRSKVRGAEREAHGLVQKAEAGLASAEAKVGRKVAEVKADVKADVKARAQRAEAGLASVEAKVEHTVQDAKAHLAEAKTILGVNVVQVRRTVAAGLEKLSTTVERAGRDAAAALRRIATKVDVATPHTEVVGGDRVVILQQQDAASRA